MRSLPRPERRPLIDTSIEGSNRSKRESGSKVALSQVHVDAIALQEDLAKHIRHELLIGPFLGLLEDASRLSLGTRRDEELDGTDRVGAFAAFTSNIDDDALGFESAFGDLCLDP